MSLPDQREEATFEAALQLPPEQRAVYLDRTCANDPELRRSVEGLLGALERAGGFLTKPIISDGAAAATVSLPLTEKPGDRFGRYKLLQQIGEGGCGVVYMAEQEEPVRRRVALKVIKLGMDTGSVVARFEAERQALALMDHPNIATVLDAGATDTGRPFFVMELVRGIKITDYCDQNQISPRERLDLFMQICRAIQHAHQKGIIHRDIKPSNILITLNDGVPVPKIIDFGIAKATQGRLTDKTLFTAFELFIGTPAYMSPEQATMTSIDVDTRSDIYSLGVLLYELLTGKTPFDAKELIESGLDEMRRTIREVEPIKPSTRLTQEAGRVAPRAPSSGENTSASGAHGVTRPASQPSTLNPQQVKELIHLLRGDLDWIVMKCLEKDRSDRYATANGLAADVQRHLDNEPILARPPSGLYRLQKLARRNKAAFATALVAGGAVLLALIVLVISNVRIGEAQRAERHERENAEAANGDLRSANKRLADTLSFLELQRVEDLFRVADPGAATAHLTAMLRRDPSNQIAASRLVSALVHRHWALPSAPPIRHSDKVDTACFSPDGRQVLTASRDRTAAILDAATGVAIATLPHSDWVFCARYNPDGNRIVTASADGTARIWNPTNGTALTPPLHHGGRVYWAEFSRDGQSLVTASADKTARIWDVSSGALKRQLRGDTTELLFACFSPDGQRVASGGIEGSVRMWSVTSDTMLFQVEDRRRELVALAFSPDGRWLLSACTDGIVRLWNPTTGAAAGKPLRQEGKLLFVSFSPDGKRLLTGTEAGLVRLWDPETGYPTGQTMHHEGGINFGEFSPDGRMIATASVDNSARIWDARSGELMFQPLRHRERVAQARFSPEGRRLVTAGHDSTVQIWDLQPRRCMGLGFQTGAKINSVVFSPDGKGLLTSSADGTARVTDAVSGRPLCPPIHHDAPFEAAQFSPDGQRVVTASSDGQAQVWDWRTGRLIAGPLQHTNAIWSVQFSPDGQRVLTASIDGTAQVWDAQNGQPMTPPLKHAAEVVLAQFSRDGQFVVTASKDRSARVWNAQTGEPVTQPLLHLDHLKWAEFSPDGERVITASSDNTACIWDSRTSRLLCPPLQHTRIVERAGFSRDGRRVVTASWDQTARVWDAVTGQPLGPPFKHHSPVTHAFFSPDGQRILTSCVNGTIRLWDSNTGRPLTEWLDTGGGIGNTVCFDSSGWRIAAGVDNGMVHIWNMRPAPMPVPDSFLILAEAVAEMRVNAVGNLEAVPRSEFQAIVQDIRLRGTNEFYDRVAQWFLADPAQRSAAGPL